MYLINSKKIRYVSATRGPISLDLLNRNDESHFEQVKMGVTASTNIRGLPFGVRIQHNGFHLCCFPPGVKSKSTEYFGFILRFFPPFGQSKRSFNGFGFEFVSTCVATIDHIAHVLNRIAMLFEHRFDASSVRVVNFVFVVDMCRIEPIDHLLKQQSQHIPHHKWYCSPTTFNMGEVRTGGHFLR
jgi:hypothetical protein